MEGNISGCFLCLELGIGLHSLSIVLASEVFQIAEQDRIIFQIQGGILPSICQKQTIVIHLFHPSNDYQNFQLFLAASSTFLSASSFNRRL
jgi:hypothetical protein